MSMIKAISANPIRKTAMALLVTAPLMLGACKSGNNNNQVQQNQTEVVSEAGSNALKAQILLEMKLKKPLYSSERNLKMQERVHLTDRTEEMKANTDKSIDLVKNLSTFNSTAQLQLILDGMAFFDVVDNYARAYKDFDKVDKYNDMVLNWDSEVRYLTASGKLVKDKLSSAQECSKFCDDYLKMFDLATEEDIKDYEKSVGEFIAKQKDLGSVQQMADLISYKIFKADSILYKRIIEKYPIYNEPAKYDENKTFDEYFQKYFVDVARPEP